MINQKDFPRSTLPLRDSSSSVVLWPGDETRGFSTNENKIPSLLPCARRARVKAATQVVPTIIVTIILALVTRKPWNTKQPCLIHRTDRVRIRSLLSVVSFQPQPPTRLHLSKESLENEEKGEERGKIDRRFTYPTCSLIENTLRGIVIATRFAQATSLFIFNYCTEYFK